MFLTGQYLVQKMNNKYNIEFSVEDINRNFSRLTNQLWKLIPMREGEENWQGQLSTVLIEIVGLGEIFVNPTFLQLISKLEGLSITNIPFEIYRKTVFECISLLQELKKQYARV